MSSRLQAACSYISMPVSCLRECLYKKKFTLMFLIISGSLEILLNPRNGCVLRRNELYGQEDRTESWAPSLPVPALSSELDGLTLLILVTTLWDKPCYYPQFTDGNSGAARSAHCHRQDSTAQCYLGILSAESPLSPTVPCLLGLPQRPYKAFNTMSECGKHPINDNFFCCCVYNYYNDFSRDSSLVSNLTHRQELKTQSLDWNSRISSFSNRHFLS